MQNTIKSVGAVRLCLLGLVVTLLVCSGAYSFAQAGVPQSKNAQASSYSEFAEYHLKVGKMATLARRGDANGIAQLSYAIFDRVGLPLDVANALHYTQRVAQAETDYRNGSQPPVHAEDLVNAHNGFVRALSLPEWTSTDVKEMQMLRMQFAARYPQLLGNHALAGKDDKLQILSNDISPAEAVFLSTSLIYQKLFNAEFQMTQAERASNSSLSESVHLQRSKELYRVLHGNTDNVDIVDLVRAADDVFNGLNISGKLRPEFTSLPSETSERGSK
jgi:hypothetical protein